MEGDCFSTNWRIAMTMILRFTGMKIENDLNSIKLLKDLKEK